MTDDQGKNKPGTGEKPAQPASAGKGKASRRKTLKGVVAGGAVFGGSHWMKPVIKTVVMPAHAQTSPGGNGGPSPTTPAGTTTTTAGPVTDPPAATTEVPFTNPPVATTEVPFTDPPVATTELPD